MSSLTHSLLNYIYVILQFSYLSPATKVCDISSLSFYDKVKLYPAEYTLVELYSNKTDTENS